MYGKIIVGKKYTDKFHVYITKDDKIISPFHDIELHPENNHIISVVNEIPRFANGKFEIDTEKDYNPIRQDEKNGELRFIDNIFPFKGYPWNYGAIPQTWENPEEEDPHTKENGDNDPLDVIDISNVYKGIGDIYHAKVLGVLGLIDGGECDYKIVVIDTKDDKHSLINNLNDVEQYYPNLLSYTLEWFRNYKLPDGKCENAFAFGGKFKDKEFAMQIIKECHESWNKLFVEKIGETISKKRGPIKLNLEANEEEDKKKYTGFYHKL